jgi:hypothetical protein
MSIVQKLTEGIINRDLSREGAALINKWQSTGLLEGIEEDHLRNGMACLLENQAKELLRESSSMAAGDVDGFAAVAFPLVRRVFGNLIANDLVSVQPMSLPSGLIFFLDFTVSEQSADRRITESRLGYNLSSSFYGGGIVGSQITGGVDLSAQMGRGGGPYNLNTGYASPTGSSALVSSTTNIVLAHDLTLSPQAVRAGATFGYDLGLDSDVQFDPDFTSGSTHVLLVDVLLSGLDQVNLDTPASFNVSSSGGNGVLGSSDDASVSGSARGVARLIRRHTRVSGSGAQTRLNLVFVGTGSNGALDTSVAGASAAQFSALVLGGLTGAINTISWAQSDDFINGPGPDRIGSIRGSEVWGLEGATNIPEIDIKIDSVAITAVTKKLKAKWTPELGQDLNAYHNLDAEVELTQILSEQIALEIDREILADLVNGQTAATRYWSRAPGRFLDRVTGVEVGASTVAPDFTGNISEWYESLIETINDVSANIHRKTLRGGANFIVCSPEVANILEFTAGFRANVAVDSDKGDAGTVKVGSLSKKFDIYVDPYFLRNVVLVGRKGSSFLESGYVYAPYVPLQTTPTIFGPEDFVPRKGVMTRYAKKMVRPDLYGLVVISDMTVG